MKAFIQYRANGSLWQAGHTVWGLCAAYNHSTNPSIYLTDSEHKRSFTYARAIKSRMKRLGFVYGSHFNELSIGSLYPLKA